MTAKKPTSRRLLSKQEKWPLYKRPRYNPLACIYCRGNHQSKPDQIDVADGLDCNGVPLFMPQTQA